MAVVKGISETKDRLKVMSIGYLTNDTSRGGYLVKREDIPDYPASKQGINHVMFFNPATQEFWFEAKERELTPEERTLKAVETLMAKLEEKKIFTKEEADSVRGIVAK